MTADLDQEITRAVDLLTRPPRLAVGSHAPGSGYGCAMNLLAWERYGDKASTFERDQPEHVDARLRSVMIATNDAACSHLTTTTDGVRVLCDMCARRVLRLAYRCVDTVGLVTTGTTERLLDLAKVTVNGGVTPWGCGCPACQIHNPDVGPVLDRVERFMDLWWDYATTEKGAELVVREAEQIVAAAERMETKTIPTRTRDLVEAAFSMFTKDTPAEFMAKAKALTSNSLEGVEFVAKGNWITLDESAETFQHQPHIVKAPTGVLAVNS